MPSKRSYRLIRFKQWLWVLPVFIFLLMTVIYPLIYAVYMALFRYDPNTGSYIFTGLTYATRMISDMRWWGAFLTDVKILAMAIPAELVIGLGLAMLLKSKLVRGASVFRLIYIIPIAASPLMISVLWRMMFEKNYGMINHMLSLVKISPLDWLGADYALLTIAIVEVWQWAPFFFLICLAGLEAIPPDLTETALVDGARGWYMFRYVTLRAVAIPLAIASVIRIVDIIKIFDVVFALTQGGPGIMTEPPTMTIYNQYFFFVNEGYAALLSFILLIVITIITNIYFRVVRVE